MNTYSSDPAFGSLVILKYVKGKQANKSRKNQDFKYFLAIFDFVVTILPSLSTIGVINVITMSQKNITVE